MRKTNEWKKKGKLMKEREGLKCNVLMNVDTIKEKRQSIGERGITLIALVVTVIILLILAGVTLKISLGQDGLFSRAQNAVERYRVAQENEKNDITKLEEQLGSLGIGEGQGGQGGQQGGGQENPTKTYTITYDLNGGTGDTPEAQKKEEGKDIQILGTTAKKEGFIFQGWATSKEQADAGNIEYKEKATYSIDADLELWAVWYADKTKLKIGQVVKYEPKAEQTSYPLESKVSGFTQNQPLTPETYTWKIMNVNNDTGEVEIMGVPEKGMEEVWFRGPTGYNNGVYLLNDICEKLYSNTELGVKARSINIEDIEEQMSPAGIEAKEAFESPSSGVKYGGTKTYEGSDAWYPKLALYENHVGIDIDTLNTEGIGESDDGSSKTTIPMVDDSSNHNTNSKTQGSRITIQYMSYNITQEEKYYNVPEFYQLVFGTEIAYWLASRCTSHVTDAAGFEMRYIGKNKVDDFLLFSSSNGVSNFDHCIAPVVSLGSKIQFLGDGVEGWTIKSRLEK